MYSEQELREIAHDALAAADCASALQLATTPEKVRDWAHNTARAVARLRDAVCRPADQRREAIPSLPLLLNMRPHIYRYAPLLFEIVEDLRAIARCVGLYEKSDWSKPPKIEQCREENLFGFVADIRGEAAPFVNRLRNAANSLLSGLEGGRFQSRALADSSAKPASVYLAAGKNVPDRATWDDAPAKLAGDQASEAAVAEELDAIARVKCEPAKVDTPSGHKKNYKPRRNNSQFLTFLRQQMKKGQKTITEIAQKFADENGGSAIAYCKAAQRDRRSNRG